MKKIFLDSLKLKTFTEQNALDYCSINNINSDDITELFLSFNQLTDISGIKLFKNLQQLFLQNNKIEDISVIQNLNKLADISLRNNKIKDISVIQYLTEIKYLNIGNLELESDQIKYIKSLNNLETLYCYKGFKDMKIIKQLNKNIEIYDK